MNNTLHYQFITKLSQLPFVDEIWLYGSRARAQHHERSDIDLAIVCPHATTEDWYTIMNIIETADTLLAIDCIRLDTLEDDVFKKNVLRDKKLLYRKTEG